MDEDTIKRLRSAAEDLRYLLDKGYKKEGAVNFVANRYNLDGLCRSILYRAVISKMDVEEIRRRHASLDELVGSKVVIDGFNLINTLHTIYKGCLLIMCDDGVIRDVSEVHGKFRFADEVKEVINCSVGLLKDLHVSEAIYYYESQISRSGEVSAFTRESLAKFGLKGNAVTTKSVDSVIIKEGCIAITSDSALILRVKRFFDLAGYFLINKQRGRYINI